MTGTRTLIAYVAPDSREAFQIRHDELMRRVGELQDSILPVRMTFQVPNNFIGRWFVRLARRWTSDGYRIVAKGKTPKRGFKSYDGIPWRDCKVIRLYINEKEHRW